MENRTPNLLLAKQALYQLSYGPVFVFLMEPEVGLEPTNLLITSQPLYQLSYSG